MLAPQSRRYLYDILRPDPGYEFDCAVGTTFTLDLMTLLTTPLAFAVFGWLADESPQNALGSPVALLESLRRYARRMSIFCQAGQIKVSPHHQLFAFIEETVVEVMPPNPQGAFHPKIWVLRYKATSAGNPQVHYRVLCLSRNLTFDRSWDTALVLEGGLGDGNARIDRNTPLSDFVSALTDLTIHPAKADVVERCRLLADELQFVDFNLPEGFTDLEFLPLGVPYGNSWPFPPVLDRLCVVSPFLEGRTLERLSAVAEDVELISRADELARIPEAVRGRFTDTYVLNDAEAISGDGTQPKDDVGEESEPPNTELHGLHAKLYIGESGPDVHIWTGSANATSAAFSRNVEFLIRLDSQVEAHGIDRFLGANSEEAGLIDLLEPFALGNIEEADQNQRMMEKVLRLVRRNLAKTRLVGHVSGDDHDSRYTVELTFASEITVPAHTVATCRPLTLRPDDEIHVPSHIGDDTTLRFPNVSFEALTPFFVFRLVAELEDELREESFVLRAHLEGMPENRLNRLLGVVLSNREQVLRLIMLLLADDDSLSSLWSVLTVGGENHTESQRKASPFPLFETMVRSLSSDPTRLDTVADLITELRRIPETQALLPKRLEEIWDPIWQVRQAVSTERHDGAH